MSFFRKIISFFLAVAIFVLQTNLVDQIKNVKANSRKLKTALKVSAIMALAGLSVGTTTSCNKNVNKNSVEIVNYDDSTRIDIRGDGPMTIYNKDSENFAFKDMIWDGITFKFGYLVPGAYKTTTGVLPNNYWYSPKYNSIKDAILDANYVVSGGNKKLLLLATDKDGNVLYRPNPEKLSADEFNKFMNSSEAKTSRRIVEVEGIAGYNPDKELGTITVNNITYNLSYLLGNEVKELREKYMGKKIRVAGAFKGVDDYKAVAAVTFHPVK